MSKRNSYLTPAVLASRALRMERLIAIDAPKNVLEQEIKLILAGIDDLHPGVVEPQRQYEAKCEQERKRKEEQSLCMCFQCEEPIDPRGHGMCKEHTDDYLEELESDYEDYEEDDLH